MVLRLLGAANRTPSWVRLVYDTGGRYDVAVDCVEDAHSPFNTCLH